MFQSNGRPRLALAPAAEELWAELVASPEHLEGEIIDGEPCVQPRHARTIEARWSPRRPFDDDGPGGWGMVPEPGSELAGAPEVSADLAG